MNDDMRIIETNESETVRLVVDADGSTYLVQRHHPTQGWFTAVRNPRPFLANDTTTTGEAAAQEMYAWLCQSV